MKVMRLMFIVIFLTGCVKLYISTVLSKTGSEEKK